MNSAGYSVFDEPIRAREKCYSPARLRLINTYSILIEVDSGRISTERRRREVDIH